MKIILEGAKGTGKTTLSKALEKKGFKVFHSSSETKNDLDYHLNLLEQDGDCVLDRFSIGEVIYPFLYSRVPKITLEQMEQTLRKTNSKGEDVVTIILFSSNPHQLISRVLLRDGGMPKGISLDSIKKSNDLFEFLGDNLIFNKENNVELFDVSVMSTEDIMEVLEIEYGI